MESLVNNVVLKNLVHDVHPVHGVTNTSIDELAKAVCKNFYKGTLSANKFKEMMHHRERLPEIYTFIVNVGAHFVVLHKRKNCVFYIDPVGEKCLNKDLRAFVTKQLLKYEAPCFLYNKRKIQSLESSHCGLYCVLFSLLFDFCDVPFSQVHFVFTKKPSRENDTRCVEYIEQLLEIQSNLQLYKRWSALV